MKVMDSFRFFFTAPEWKNNLMIASVFVFIPVIGQLALYGWQSEIAQRMSRGEAQPIVPLSFDQLMPYMQRGIAPFLSQMAASLPLTVLVVIGNALIIMALAIASSSVVVAILLAAMYLFIIVVGSLLTVVLASILLTRAELCEDISTTFDFAALKRYARAVWKPTLFTHFVFLLLSSVFAFVAFLFCCVGIFPAAAIINLAMMHLRMQLYEGYLAQGGEAFPVKAP
ncbi:MAG: DUF4013 domain-containing protein [Myxococcota bacterium]|jgi:hypothetical protein|nr:DUF4013 domain-containing protein [Myxococcota bacterium]